MNFTQFFEQTCKDMIAYGDTVDTGQWQSTADAKDYVKSVELRFRTFHTAIDSTIGDWAEEIKPNLPWAEDHFQERVSGIPWNPPPSAAYWPFAQVGHKEHTDASGRFSHTYPGRLWGLGWQMSHREDSGDSVAKLSDLVGLLYENPQTRQAFIPIWWPTDGITAGHERVPCTIGYHFLIRNGVIDLHYFMRSCDLLRYFRDDVYMAGRLVQWLCDELNDPYWGKGNRYMPGDLHMPITSLHVFENDLPTIRYRLHHA